MDLYQNSYEKALDVNTANGHKWRGYKEKLLQTKENLQNFLKSHSLDIMVPIGKKAYVRGKLQHTNEVTVCHGASMFSDCSSEQAVNLIKMRLINCETQLQALEKERDLFTNKLELPQDTFSQRREIVEEYDEEAESKWRLNHAVSVKRQKKIEAEERQKRNSDEKISKVFDNLEMMEELAEELENLEVQENDTLEKLMSGKLKIPEGKRRFAHSSKDQPILKTSREINNNDLISQNNQEIVDLLRTYRCKIREVLRNVKKDDERNVNLFLDLIELKDDIEDDIRKMNDDEDYSESDEKDSDDETTASIEVKVPQEETKRKVRFSTSLEDVKLIESKSEQYECSQSENNIIQIHFQHSNAKFLPNDKSDVSIAHPGEIIKLHNHESPVVVRKSILKNKGKDEDIRKQIDEKQVVKVFSSDTKIVGDVVEHKQNSGNMVQDEIIHIKTKDETPKKVSKFKQMRSKS